MKKILSKIGRQLGENEGVEDGDQMMLGKGVEGLPRTNDASPVTLRRRFSLKPLSPTPCPDTQSTAARTPMSWTHSDVSSEFLMGAPMTFGICRLRLNFLKKKRERVAYPFPWVQTLLPLCWRKTLVGTIFHWE